MKLQDKLEGLASTAFERKMIRLWLREGKARSSFVRALGESSRSSKRGHRVESAKPGHRVESANQDTALNPRLGEGLPDRA
jgi:hypothetical protein